MCGITGIWSPQRGGASPDVLSAMGECIRHRGPDDNGVYFDPDAGVGLGHRRLSIVDLSTAGHQPMRSASGRYWVVFNGEIYNYRALRTDLHQAGATFHGDSDTEVMLAAIERWGLRSAVERLVGMFAIALWDTQERRLHLIRDRAGEKPLYVGTVGGATVFSSEIRSIRAFAGGNLRISMQALGMYLRYGYVPGPASIYEGIEKVRPGTIVTIERREGRFHSKEESYWNAHSAISRAKADGLGTDCNVLIDELDKALRTAVRGQMVADVPLGAFLSGGVDSSLIVALMQVESSAPVRTFTMGFEDPAYDEAPYAQSVAEHLGTSHTAVYVTERDVLDAVPRMAAIYDEPFADSSQIPTYLVAGIARRSVTVSLSGDGGDELFAGYHRYKTAATLWSRMARVPYPLRRATSVPLRLVERAAAAMQISDDEQVTGLRGRQFAPSRLGRLAAIMSSPSFGGVYDTLVSAWFDPGEVIKGFDGRQSSVRLQHPPDRLSNIEQLMYRDMMTYLPDDILVKVDRATMAWSLESRAPFLDHRVMETAWRIPIALRAHAREPKWILRRLLERYLPAQLVNRPKHGFSVPIATWLRGPLRDWARDLLAPEKLQAEGYFDPAAVQRKWAEHEAGGRTASLQLWTLLMFQAWCSSQLTGSPAAGDPS